MPMKALSWRSRPRIVATCCHLEREGACLGRAVFLRTELSLGYNQTRSYMTSTRSPSVQAADPMLEKIVAALEEIRAEEFDYEVLRAASDVMGHDMLTSWRPSLSYLPPEERAGEYHVTVYAKGACESCPIKSSHVASIEPKVRALVGADNVFVHDYFDWFDNQFSVQYGD
jgi:hypothetical protein